MRTLILSDIHLGNKHCQAELLLAVLDREPFDRLILNGDTLHSLNLNRLRPAHWTLLTRFRDIGRTRDLVLIRGNHDHAWRFARISRRRAVAEPALVAVGGGPANGAVEPAAAPAAFGPLDVLPALLDVPLREEYRLEVGGREYLVTHGDQFDPALASELPRHVAGWCYQLTRKMNRKLAKWLKKRSARWGGQLQHIRRQAVDFARQRGCGGVLLGHTHHADDVNIDGVHYVNTGCWTESPCAFVTVTHDALQLHQLPE